ncbi:GHKL domain-containing protein [Gordonibacter sp.]|uniref:GHKL domain-containing protein n=1 Tax=Gordonibacter sp. TaxID=1968902 RepID=UPI002FCA2A61
MPLRSVIRATAPVLAMFLLVGCALALTYYYDNKYIAPPPYGADGSLSLDEAALDRPVSLVDGWMLSVDDAPPTETFIGQYSDFSFAPGGTSPFGRAAYRLTLHYEGAWPHAAVLLLPEVFGDYTLYVDGRAVSQNGDGPEVGLVLGADTQLVLEVENDAYYYSGLTHPPILGTAQAIAAVQFANALATCVLVLVPLGAAVLALAVWRRREGDALVRDFGIVCLAFAVAGMHGLAWRFGFAGPWWYALEDAAWMCVLVGSVGLAARTAGVPWADSPRRLSRLASRVLWTLPLACLVWVAIVIPLFPHSMGLYGLFQTFSRILCWALFAACAAVAVRRRSVEARLILLGCALLGLALLANLLDNNAYEPLYGLWQHEYAGLMLVGVFGWMLAARVRRLRTAQSQVRDLEVQVRSAEESLVHVRQGERAVRAAQHDLRHHVGMLKQMADRRAWDECAAYLDELSEAQNAQPPLVYAKNIVANAVLAAYLTPAQAAGVRVDCDVRVPESLALRSTELVVLLSNLLSNAAEACERVQQEGSCATPSIAFAMRLEGGALVVRCENSAPGNAAFGPTTKPDACRHGLGLSIMRQVVARHGGELFADVADGKAVVRMAVPLGE